MNSETTNSSTQKEKLSPAAYTGIALLFVCAFIAIGLIYASSLEPDSPISTPVATHEKPTVYNNVIGKQSALDEAIHIIFKDKFIIHDLIDDENYTSPKPISGNHP